MNDLVPTNTESRSQGISIEREVQHFELLSRKAKALATASVMPERFRGNFGDCMIVAEIADRVGYPLLMVAQSLYIVNGTPSFSGKFAIALINSSPNFSNLQYEIEGDDPFKDDYRIRAYAYAKGSEVPITGPWIDWKTVKGEGWKDKTGSKWKTIPGIMFVYRAASWWCNQHAPELLLGMRTMDEELDIIDVQATERTSAASKINAIVDEAFDNKTQPDKESTPTDLGQKEALLDSDDAKVSTTYATLRSALERSETLEDLAENQMLIERIASAQHRKELSEVCQQRMDYLTKQD